MLPLYSLTFVRKIFIAAAVSIVLAFLVYLSTAQALSTRAVSASPQVSSDKVYLGVPTAAAPVVSEEAPMREVHIANSGLTLLRGATVISISRDSIRVALAWGSANFTWTVETGYNTKFLTSKGAKETIEDIRVGDVITVTGTLKSSGAEPVVEADFVRE